MLVVKPDSRLDYFDWSDKSDPQMENSAFHMIPRRNSGIFGGEIDVVLFKSRELADAFRAQTGLADRDIGLLEVAKDQKAFKFTPAK